MKYRGRKFESQEIIYCLVPDEILGGSSTMTM